MQKSSLSQTVASSLKKAAAASTNTTMQQDHHPAPCSTVRFMYSTVSNVSWLKNWFNCKDKSGFSSCEGFLKETAQFYGDALRMNVTLVQPSEFDGFGIRMPNGSWTTGITKDVVEGRADFSFGALVPDRRRDTHCMDPTLDGVYGILVPTPQEKPFIRSMVQPFSWETWLALLFAILGMGLFMTFFKKHYQNFSWLALVGTFLGHDLNIRHAVVWKRHGDIDSINRRNSDFSRTSEHKNGQYQGQRIFPLGTWFVAIVFIISCYTALVFNFFMDPYEKRLSNLDQVVNSYHDITINANLYRSVVFMPGSSKNPTLDKLAVKMRVLKREDDLGYFPGPGEAFIDEENILSFRIVRFQQSGDDRWKTSYVISQRDPLPTFSQGPFFRKGFCKAHKAKAASAVFEENGFKVRLERVFLNDIKVRMRMNGKIPEKDNRPITLKHVYGLFVCLMVGHVLALAAFILEHCTQRFKLNFWL